MVRGAPRILTVLLASALLALPVLNAQPSNGKLNEEILAKPGAEITFYGHLFDIDPTHPMPMNTQFPDSEDDFSRGYSGGCGNAPPLPDDSADCELGYSLNEEYWYTTAGFVQIKSGNEFSYDKLHNERGQTKDIYFDTDTNPVSTFYMSADFHGWSVAFCPYGVCWNWDPGYYQDWVVETTVVHANLGEWSTDPSARPDMTAVRQRTEDVTIVAHGQTDPITFWSLDPTIPLPEAEKTVWPFMAELEWDPAFVDAGGVVPFKNDLIVEFEWYQLTDGQKYILSPSAVAAGLTWNVNAGEDYPNNIVLPVRNPLDVELVFPRFVHDKLVILSVLNTPWGSYDVDLDSITFDVANSAGTPVVPDADKFQTLVDQSVAHSGHYDPINLTYIWDYKAQGLKPGDYTLTIGADNFQGSYHTETQASFTIASDGSGKGATAGQSGILTLGGDFEEVTGGSDSTASNNAGSTTESKGSPGPATALVGVALLAAAFVQRRRDA